MKRSTLSLVVIAIVGRPTETRAQLCTSWPAGTEVQVYLNKLSFTEAGFDGTTVEHIVRAAIDEWTTSGRANVRMRYAGLRDYLVLTGDAGCSNTGQDVIIQANPGKDPDDPGLAGIAECDPDDSPAPCCVRIFSGWPWSVGFPTGAAPNDLWTVLTHELGHVLCQWHSDVAIPGECGAADPSPHHTMYPGAAGNAWTTRRFLKPMDVCRLQALYGDRTNYVVDHRYDTDGVEMQSTHGAFSFLGDPQDGLALAVDTATYYAAFSDIDGNDAVKLAVDDGGVDWGDAGSSVGGANAIQVPAVAVGGGKVVVAYLYGQTHDAYGRNAWSGTGRSIWVKWSANNGASWSDAIYIGTSYSGPALAYRGSGCFVIAYATDASTCPDCIRTQTSCDYGQTWGNTITSTVRVTDRPAIAWRAGAGSGGITWPTNVLDNGTVTANHLRHGLLTAWAGAAHVSPIAAGNLYYTSNFPSLMVSDSAAPQPNRFVRIHRSTSDSAASGRLLYRSYSDDLNLANWNGYGSTGAYSRSPPTAGYSSFYDEFWTMFTR